MMRTMNHTQPRMLYVMPERKKEKQIEDLCRDLGILPREIKEGEESRAVGVLAGTIPPELEPKPEKQAPGGYRLPELLVFCGLEDGLLDRFLAEYRQRKIEPTGLKAVMTPHNLFWPVYELAEELRQEQAAMQMARRSREGQ